MHSHVFKLTFKGNQWGSLQSLQCVGHFYAALWCQMKEGLPPAGERSEWQEGCWASHRSNWLQTPLSRPLSMPEQEEVGHLQKNLELKQTNLSDHFSC